MFKLLLDYVADTDGSFGRHEDESFSSSSSVASHDSTIFSGLNSFISSPELKRFRTPIFTEEEKDRDESNGCQVSHGDETCPMRFTDDRGCQNFYNPDQNFSTCDDPRIKKVLVTELPF